MSSTESAYFEIGTDSGLFVKGRTVPSGVIAMQHGVEAAVVVESFQEADDRVGIRMSGGYRLRLPASRITSILTRDAA